MTNEKVKLERSEARVKIKFHSGEEEEISPIKGIWFIGDSIFIDNGFFEYDYFYESIKEIKIEKD